MKYIFLDIDGTLYDHGNNGIPESAVYAVRRAVENGHRVFICTGRPCCLLDHVKELPYTGVIASAGAYVKAGERVIYEEHIGKEALKEIMDSCVRLHILYLLEGRRGVYLQRELWDYFEKGEGQAQAGHEFFRQKPVRLMKEYRETEEQIYKLCLYAGEEEPLHTLSDHLGEEYQLTLGKAEAAQPYCAELTLKRNNKASGIKKILDYYKGSMEDTIAVGDSLNDLEMLKECGVGIAMGNADERLKPYADYVTSDIDKDGVYLAMKKYGLAD